MSDPEELGRWAAAFKGGASAAPSIEDVLARAGRDMHKERLELVFQLLATAFAVAVFLGLVVWTRSLHTAVLAALVLPVLVALLGLFLSRYSQAKSPVVSVEEHAADAVRRWEARCKFARANFVALVVLTVVFWGWLPFFILSRSERFVAQPWRLAIAVIAGVTVFGFGFWRSAVGVKKANTELESWRATRDALREPGPPS